MKLLLCFTTLGSAITLACCQGIGPGVQQHGYVEVREGAHIFWWLYHTTANVTEASDRPLIIWLMGGPGGSATVTANFLFVGPVDYKLNPRESNWVKDYNILFIDSPVGAGFSYVDDFRYLNNKNSEIVQDLMTTLKAFYVEAPKFLRSPTYIYGVSYGGKKAADLGLLLHEVTTMEIQVGNLNVDFRGIAFASPWISPVDSTLAYGKQLYEMGLVDGPGLLRIQSQTELVKEHFEAGDFFAARMNWDKTLELIDELTDGVDIYYLTGKPQREQPRINFMDSKINDETDDFFEFINTTLREALDIPDQVVFSSQVLQLRDKLFVDFIMPVTDSVERLLNTTDLELYVCSGNLDMIVSTPGALNWVNKLKWPGTQSFKDSTRRTLWIDNTMEGYFKESGRLHFYWLNVAGHSALDENKAAHRAFMKALTGF